MMSYAQLEALINKWSSELEDQERHFLQQATQVNAWDRMLVENGEKVEECIHLLARCFLPAATYTIFAVIATPNVYMHSFYEL